MNFTKFHQISPKLSGFHWISPHSGGDPEKILPSCGSPKTFIYKRFGRSAAWQVLFHTKIHSNSCEFHQISPNFTKFHQNLGEFHQISLNLGEFHQISSILRWMPPNLTKPVAVSQMSPRRLPDDSQTSPRRLPDVSQTSGRRLPSIQYSVLCSGRTIRLGCDEPHRSAPKALAPSSYLNYFHYHQY